MQTRQITEVKVYKLILNPMRGNMEDSRLVAIAYEKEKLLNWYTSFRAPEVIVEEGSPSFECQGNSHTWRKTFNVGSPLEWYNPMDNENINHYGHGIQEEWAVEEIIQQFSNTRGIPIIR